MMNAVAAKLELCIANTVHIPRCDCCGAAEIARLTGSPVTCTIAAPAAPGAIAADATATDFNILLEEIFPTITAPKRALRPGGP